MRESTDGAGRYSKTVIPGRTQFHAHTGDSFFSAVGGVVPVDVAGTAGVLADVTVLGTFVSRVSGDGTIGV